MGRWIAELKKCENAENGHCQNRQNPDGGGFVSFVSLSSGQIREFFAPDANDLWVQYEERAAVLEYDGGHSRADAERLAREEVFGSGGLSDDEIDALIESSPRWARCFTTLRKAAGGS